MMIRFPIGMPRWSTLRRPYRFRRSGVSLLEVMFSIGVVMIGLVGIAALLPVGGDLARKGAVADAAAQVGASAVRQFSACGMNNPRHWRWYHANQFTAVVPDQGFTPPPGKSFCLDPVFIHDPASPDRELTADQLRQERSARREFPLNRVFGDSDPPLLWMPRITLPGPVNGGLHQLCAEELFYGDDDLVFHLPSDRTEGPQQTFSEFADESPVKRNAERNISWMATLVPKLDRRGLNPTDEYTLSVVVFDRRPIDRRLYGDDAVSEDSCSERVVEVPSSNFYSGWPAFGGGDMTLVARSEREPDGDGGASDLELSSGDWIMLSRWKPLKAVGTVQVHKWYRVVHAADVVYTSPPERDVTLVGPDWDYDQTGNPLLQTQATIVHGVVDVLEKTVRLQTSSMWIP